MKYNAEDIKFISGDAFSSGYSMKLGSNPLLSRNETLLNILGGGKILHIGCCDHLGLIDTKVKNHTWLHGLLDEACDEVIGIDINKEAVDYINSRNYSKQKIICADVTQDIIQTDLATFEYVLLGDVIEHIDNPVYFLQKLRENLEKFGFSGKYIISTPNAFTFLKGIYKRGIEGINSDHRYWFTPYTLAKVMYNAGIMPLEYFFADYSAGYNTDNRLINLAFRVYRKLTGKVSSYKSFQGGQMVVVGISKDDI